MLNAHKTADDHMLLSGHHFKMMNSSVLVSLIKIDDICENPKSYTIAGLGAFPNNDALCKSIQRKHNMIHALLSAPLHTVDLVILPQNQIYSLLQEQGKKFPLSWHAPLLHYWATCI